jgi:Peptidase family M48
MLVIGGQFGRNNYNFEYVRREFLGAVRCLVFDVSPKKSGAGTFKGRIWVEDQDYNIVRFNGTYGPSTMTKMFFHFDSWREYMGPGVWLPAFVYTEESDMGYLAGSRHLRFKGQTRLWGYNVGKSNAQNELTALTVESDQVKDTVDEAEGMSPVRALRAWERQAEDNVIQRLEKAGLLAPDGEVNKVLETVINNLEVTNNLDIQPEVRARVLLTSPLESFTIGHTIVISRGMIDVLPDEASLAAILARELAHIALGHRLDTKYAFSDRMLFEDPEAFQAVYLRRDDKEEADADMKAAELLKNSPYKDKLGNAGLFLKAVDQRAAVLTHLLMPHMGNTMIKGRQEQRLASLKETAPKLEMAKVDQIAALPLGGRVRVDPWSAKVEMMKSKPVALLSAREKMPFEVTPIYLYLTRQTGAPQTASSEPTNAASGVKQ